MQNLKNYHTEIQQNLECNAKKRQYDEQNLDNNAEKNAKRRYVYQQDLKNNRAR